MKVLGIAGSLREESYNALLLRAAAEVLPDGVELELWRGLKAVPPFDEDDEEGPSPVPTPSSLRRRSTTDRSPAT